MRLTRKQIKDIRMASSDIDRADLAKKLRSTPETIRHILMGHQLVSPQRAKKIEKLTGIPAKVFRPDVFE